MGGAFGLVPGAAPGRAPADDAGRPATSTTDAAPEAATPTAPSTWPPPTGETPDASAGGNDAGPRHPVPRGSGTGKRVVFDMDAQRVWLVGRAGRVQRTYLVSGSLHDNLDPGRYEVYSRSLHAVSFDGKETMDRMVRFAHGVNAPIGFHDIPELPDGTLVQTKAQLGTPQSAGCVRQWADDAKALWRFAPVGTRVVVVA